MSNTIREAHRQEQKTQAKHRRELAIDGLYFARCLASQNGISLQAKSEVHYQFRFDGLILNFYPGNQRLYWDKNHGLGSFLRMPENVKEWTLLGIVRAIVAHGSKMERQGRT